MLFTYDSGYANSVATWPDLFHNRLSGSPFGFDSALPDLDVGTMWAWDTIQELTGFQGTPSAKNVIPYMERAGLFNTIESIREALGNVAVTAGIPSFDFPLLSDLFQGNSYDISGVITKLISGINQVLASEAFQQALDMIGAIPIVGWIVQAIAAIAQFAWNMASQIGASDLATAEREFAARFHLPPAEFSREMDEGVTRLVQMAIRDKNSQWLVRPRYGIYSHSDWKGTDVRFQDTNWNAGYSLGGENITGVGFVPGTRNLHRKIQFNTTGHSRSLACDSMMDTGSLYPTVKTTMLGWWNQILKPSPAMFTVNAPSAADEWMNYIHRAFTFAWESLRQKAWSGRKTSEFDKDYFMCKEDHGTGGNDAKRVSDGKEHQCKMIPGREGKKYYNKLVVGDTGAPRCQNGHYSAYVGYLYSLFFGTWDGWAEIRNNPNQDLEGLAFFDDIDYGKAAPVAALDDLYDRQEMALKSMMCMYVNDDDPVYAALYGQPNANGSLRETWYANVQAMFDSGYWRQVVAADVPPGKVRDSLKIVAEMNGMNPENLNEELNPPCPVMPVNPETGKRRRVPFSHPCLERPFGTGKSPFPDQAPPPPPPPQYEVKSIAIVDPGGKTSKTGGGGVALAALAATAFVLSKR